MVFEVCRNFPGKIVLTELDGYVLKKWDTCRRSCLMIVTSSRVDYMNCYFCSGHTDGSRYHGIWDYSRENKGYTSHGGRNVKPKMSRYHLR